MKKNVVVFLLMFSSMCANAGQYEDPTILGFLTLAKTTVHELESHIPQHCRVDKKYRVVGYNPVEQKSIIDTNEFAYYVRNNCFDLIGNPTAILVTENKRIVYVEFKFKEKMKLEDYRKIFYSKYGQPFLESIGQDLTYKQDYTYWKKGDTVIGLVVGPDRFSYHYRFEGDLGKYDSNYNIKRKRTENML